MYPLYPNAILYMFKLTLVSCLIILSHHDYQITCFV